MTTDPLARLDFLVRPSRTAWLFALRTTLAALAALAAAMLLGLENPWWAAMTTVVVAQPVRGQVIAKGLYRIVGTVLGAVAGAVMLLTLRAVPAVLVVALALWIGACTAMANLLRGYRAYGAVLASVTAALVALMAFSHPDTALALGAVRASEVLLGVVVSGVVALLFLPASDVAGFLQQARRVADDGIAWAEDALRDGYDDGAVRRERRLVVEMANLVDTADQIAAGSRRFLARMPHMRGLMASVLSLMAAVRALALHASRTDLVREDVVGASLARLAGARARLRAPPSYDDDAIHDDQVHDHTIHDAHAMRGYLDDLDAALASIHADYHALGERDAGAPRGELAVHGDRTAALRTGIRAVVTIVLVGALWLATGWEGGGPMVMSCAIMCSIFATHPMPARGVRSSLAGAALAYLAALLVRNVLLPAGTGILPAIAVLALLLVVGTLAMANRPTAIVGTELSMMFMFMTEPGRPWTHDAGYLPVTGGGIVIGVAIATIVFALVLPVHPEQRFRALSREIVYDLQRLASARSLPAAQGWRARTYHRVLRLVVRAGTVSGEPETAIDGGLAAITVGGALARLHGLEHGGALPPAALATIAHARRAVGMISLDPARAAAIVREAAARLEDASRIPGDADARMMASELARARLALVEIAEALDANPRFFGVAE